jgi:solute carrier family 25 protein 39/40
VEETQKKTYTSTIDGLRKIARNEGILSLWRGLSPTLVMAIPANVIYFTGYDWLRFDGASPIARYVDDGWAPLVAGSVARITAATAISPIEMFRTRLQATSGEGTDHFRRTLQGLGQLIRANGYSSLWRGLTLTMWRDVPFSGLYWWGYEGVKKQLGEARRVAGLAGSNKTRKHPRMETFVDSFTSGAVSGAAAALITTPFDVGKTRQQVFRHGEELGSGLLASSKTVRPEALSIPRFLQHIWREEGASGLFRGWAARCLKVAPACAIMISSYEVGKQWRS